MFLGNENILMFSGGFEYRNMTCDVSQSILTLFINSMGDHMYAKSFVSRQLGLYVHK